MLRVQIFSVIRKIGIEEETKRARATDKPLYAIIWGKGIAKSLDPVSYFRKLALMVFCCARVRCLTLANSSRWMH